MTMTGGCLCGAIRYEIDGEPLMTGVCHCRNCQKQAGSAFSTLAGVPRAAFRFTAGEPRLYEDADTASGSTVQRWFCSTCGSPLYSAILSQPDLLFLKTGTLDDTSFFRPQFHVWCDTKQPWVTLDEGVPAMARQG